MTLGLFAQSWSPNDEGTWTQEHATTIIDFQLEVDGSVFQHTESTHSPNFTIAAIVDGQYRGKATNVIRNDASGMAIGSYFSMTVYGVTDPTTKQNTLANKEITLHLYDLDTELEYILPQTFTFDGEHHGTLEALEEVSYTTVTELRLADRNIYPGGEFDLNEGLSLFHGDALVEDGTQVVLNGWRLTSDSPAMPQGYTLDSQTGILTTSDDAEATTLNYSVSAGNLSGTGYLTLYYSVQGIEVFENPVEVLVGSYVSRFIIEGEQFDIYPNTADQDYTLTYVKEGFITDGYAQTAGETEVIITSTADPTKTASLTLKVYDNATNITNNNVWTIYMPSTTQDVEAYLLQYLTVNPSTAKQDIVIEDYSGDIFRMENTGKLSIIGRGESEMSIAPALHNGSASRIRITVIVYDPITKVVFPQNPIDVLVGKGLTESVQYGEQFYFTNAAGTSEGVWAEYTTALDPEDIVEDDMFAYAMEGAKVTITPVTNPEAAADLTLNVYAPAESVEAYNVRIPNTLKTHDEIYAAIMEQVVIAPTTAKQALTFDNYTDSNILTVSENIFSLSGATGPCYLTAHAFGNEDVFNVNVEVYAPVTKVVINEDPFDMLVGESTLKSLINNFYFEPTDGTISEYTVEYSDPEIVDKEGFIAKAVPEGVTVTIRPATDPEVSGTFTLRTYNEVASITVNNESGKVRIPNSLYGKGHAVIYAAIMEQIVISPATAKQELTFHSSSNMDVIAFDWDSKQNPLLKLTSADVVGETDLTARAYGYNGETEPVITVEVYQPAGNIEILKTSVDAPVGASIYDRLYAGPNGHYQIIPSTADQTVTVTAADKSIMDDEGNILKKGSTTITLASVANPELTGTITLNAYIGVTGYELYEGDKRLWSSAELPEGEYTGYINVQMDRLNKKTFTVRPIPADGNISKPFNGGNITIWNRSNHGNVEKTITLEPGVENNITPLYNEAGEMNGLTFTVHAWEINYEYNLAFEEDASAACICEIYVQVGADVHPVDGWDWVTVWGSYGTDDSGTFNYLNDANHYGGGLIDVRSQTAHLYKDPQYGLYGTLTYMGLDGGCYKMKFDATEMENDYFINYDINVEDGAGPTSCTIEKGWNWMAYPWQFDYTMSELGIMDYSNSDVVLAADGDVILASDGSMLTFNAATNKWISSEGTNYTFRYGKGYLYYTTVENSDIYREFFWGNGYDLEPKDLTTAEARARKFDRDASFWDYNPHQYPNHMAIIAKLEGLDNLEDFSIGAFVDDECRGEGKAAEEWMFITVNGDDKEYVTFRLIDKRTGICYDLSESFQFGGVSGSLKEPVIFRTGDIASGIANITEGSALIVKGDVATAAGTIQVYDIQGKVVAEGFQRIDLSQLGQGVYVVKSGNASRKVIR